jgi:hypothetical protein
MPLVQFTVEKTLWNIYWNLGYRTAFYFYVTAVVDKKLFSSILRNLELDH